ncbi:PAS domain S-box protein [Methanolobus sp. WCC4]|uniref:PAS domain S-box protein n=1 Tax=Methanolobus sp. WCC4 TaxID=3125784 RepID=UPI0030FC61FF
MQKKPMHSVLIVDDDPPSAKLLETFLSRDYITYVAGTGEEALDIIGSEKIDLVLLDIMMPGMDGYEVCRHIKSSRSTQFIQVIMITALSTRDDRLIGLEAGADEFLVKPVDRLEVLIRVRALLKSKELYDQLVSEKETAQSYFDVSGCMMVALNNDGTVKLVNRKCCEVLGYEETELTGKNWFDMIILPEDREVVSSVFSNMINGNVEEVGEFENIVLTKNGEKRIIRWNNSYLEDVDGNITGTLSSGSDVTEERLTTMKLQASEEKFRSLFENAADAILIFDLDCNIIDANSVASEMLGYDMDELLTMSRHDLIAPEASGSCAARLTDVMDGESSRFEMVYLRKDGIRIPVEMGVRIIGYNGMTSLLCNVRDISERKHSERVLQESEQRFRLLAENANDVIWTLDKSGRFNYCSPSVLKLRGYTPEEVSQQTFDEIFPEEHKNTINEAIQRFYVKLEAGEGHYSEIFEIEQYHKDGHKVWTETIANPVYDDEGNFKFFLGVSRDITERKNAEEEISQYANELARKNEELKTLERMKDEFISNLSHEIKTPLISIKGYSELLYDEALGPVNIRQKKALKTVLDKYDHLSFLMDSLIYMSIVKSGKVHYRLDPTRIVDSLNKVMDYFKVRSQDKALMLLLDVEDGLPLVQADVEYLPYLFRAIIDNAIKFSEDGSKIIIRAFKDEDNVHITVTDFGIGIPEKEIPHIFGRFYQIDGSISRRYGGSGLGLYVSKTIAEIHNGDIWVESDEGKGTTVHVRFPVYRS